MARKNVIEDPEYLKRSGKSTNYNLIQFDNSSDLTQIYWRLQGFPIKKIPHLRYLNLTRKVLKGFSL